MRYSYPKIILSISIVLSSQYSNAEKFLDAVKIIKKNKDHYLVEYFDYSNHKYYCIFNDKKVLLYNSDESLSENSIFYGQYACRSPLNDGDLFCSFRGKDSLDNEVTLYTKESNDSVLWPECD